VQTYQSGIVSVDAAEVVDAAAVVSVVACGIAMATAEKARRMNCARYIVERL
jgi:hypothetical protein